MIIETLKQAILNKLTKSFKQNSYFSLYLGSIILRIALKLKLDRIKQINKYFPKL